MCEWGTSTLVTVTTRAAMSHTGRDEVGERPIDSCIAALVSALNDGGIETTGSCCGHGREDGSILLADGRELIVRQAP